MLYFLFDLFSKPYTEHSIHGHYNGIKIIKKPGATMPGHQEYYTLESILARCTSFVTLLSLQNMNLIVIKSVICG